MTYKPSGDLVTKNGRTSQYVTSGFNPTYSINADFNNISVDTGTMLIDLSDTTNWPHTNTGSIVLKWIVIQVNPSATFLGEARVGYLSNVDATDGDFNDVVHVHMAKKSDIAILPLHFDGDGLTCNTTYHFGNSSTARTEFQTDVNLLGPDGNTSYPSGNGDLALLVTVSAGSVDVSVSLGYETVS